MPEECPPVLLQAVALKYMPIDYLYRPTFFPSAVVRLVSTDFSDFPSNLLISDRKDMILGIGLGVARLYLAPPIVHPIRGDHFRLLNI